MKNLTEITLPSNGNIEGIPLEITIREMTGSEISAIYSNFNDAAIDYVLTQTIIKPDNLNIDNLTEPDKAFILHMLRQLTYGPELEQSIRCPFCGFIHEYSINYSDFETKALESEYTTNNVFTVGNHTYTRKIPTTAEVKAIPHFIERFKVSNFDTFLVQQLLYIDNVDTTIKTNINILNHLKHLPGKDLHEVVKHLEVEFGLDTTYKVECESCAMTITGGLGLTPNLFR